MSRYRSIFFLLAALCLTLPAHSRNINKMFTYFAGEDGTLFYIYPQKMNKTADCVAKKPLTYDITCLSAGDSLTITAYVVTPERFSFSQAKVELSGNVLANEDIELLFTDVKGKKCVNRLRFKVHRSVFTTLLDSTVPFTLDYGHGCTFRFTEKAWQPMRQDLQNIFITIDSMRE